MLKNNFVKGFIKGFLGYWATYAYFMFMINIVLWFMTDESKEFYQPIWNIFDLM